jgi:hypothetical protein
MLSRYPMVDISTKDFEEVTTMEEIIFPASVQNINASQSSLSGLKDKVNSTSHYKSMLTEEIPIIHRKGKIVVDTALFKEIFEWYYINLNHPVRDCTYKSIAAVFFTNNMEAQVRDYVTKCQVCKKSKVPKKNMVH